MTTIKIIGEAILLGLAGFSIMSFVKDSIEWAVTGEEEKHVWQLYTVPILLAIFYFVYQV